MVEDSLTIAQRYVQEGRFRIARQETLVERFRSGGRDGPLREAREILALLYAIQEQFEEHLEQEWVRASALPGHPDVPAMPPSGRSVRA